MGLTPVSLVSSAQGLLRLRSLQPLRSHSVPQASWLYCYSSRYTVIDGRGRRNQTLLAAGFH